MKILRNFGRILSYLAKEYRYLSSSNQGCSQYKRRPSQMEDIVPPTVSADTGNMAGIKVEIEVDLSSTVPMAGTHSQDNFKVPKLEIKQEECQHSPVTTCDVEVKCEYECDPENDDELKTISLERRQVETEPATRDAEPNILCASHASEEPKLREQAEDSSNKKKDHSQRDLTNTSDGEITYKCDHCPRRFAFKSRLKIHSKIHTGEKPFQCDICNRRFATKSQLNLHVRIHTGEKPYECDICHIRFARNETLKLHVRTHTGEKPFVCNVCQRQFANKTHLNIHLRTHSGEKPYECNICQSRFAQKGYLKYHIGTHTDEKPYVCNVCGNQFANKIRLNVHAKIHTGEKPYECNICQSRFAQKSYLKSHLRRHSGEKPYVCEYCEKRFDRKKTLDKHHRSHTGEKPH